MPKFEVGQEVIVDFPAEHSVNDLMAVRGKKFKVVAVQPHPIKGWNPIYTLDAFHDGPVFEDFLRSVE